ASLSGAFIGRVLREPAWCQQQHQRAPKCPERGAVQRTANSRLHAERGHAQTGPHSDNNSSSSAGTNRFKFAGSVIHTISARLSRVPRSGAKCSCVVAEFATWFCDGGRAPGCCVRSRARPGGCGALTLAVPAAQGLRCAARSCGPGAKLTSLGCVQTVAPQSVVDARVARGPQALRCSPPATAPHSSQAWRAGVALCGGC
ncbi:MAG: hypothetical protein RJA98_2373, partial [Pseudomonadota bacterium]